MIFLNTTFCGGRHALSPLPTKTTPIMAIQIFDGTYNKLFLSSDASLTVNNFDDAWTYDTKVNADFNGNFEAGNVGFSVKTTDNIVIRRREKGTMDWTVIYVSPIKTANDFHVIFNDNYARAGVEYEYSLSSFCNGIENSFIIENVFSDFGGAYVTDKDSIYGTIYDLDGCDTSRNITTQTLELLNSKYMNVVSNSILNSDSGSVTGTFIKMDCTTCEIDRNGGLQYRNDFKNRLANKRPLILKVYDGRIWMIRVTGGIQDKQNGHPDIRQITFEWVEIGDVNDMKTLYLNGFSKMYVIQIKRVNGNLLAYYLGQYQPHALCVLTDNANDSKYTKSYFAKKYNCDVRNITLRVEKNSPFTVQRLGEVLDVKTGDEFENIISDSVAVENAIYYNRKSTSMNDTVTITTKMIPFLDVNVKVEYQKQQDNEVKQYIVKSVSNDTESNITHITMYRFYPLYYA